MGRFNTSGHKAKAPAALATSPLGTTSQKPDTRTFQGASGWTRTPQTELFLRAAGAFHGGERTFYESADKRDDKLRELTRTVALTDPGWGLDFAKWLRGPGNIRTGALMFAIEFVHERLDAGKTGREDINGKAILIEHYNRRIIDAVCQRADEPGEILAIWTAWYGRRIPKPVKRGVADAAKRLYSEFSLLKYDTSSKAYRFGDVLNLVHASPSPRWPHQGDLFQYALDRRHNPGTAAVPFSLQMINANGVLRRAAEDNPHVLLDTGSLKSAGMTWEDALSLGGKKKVDKAKLWEALIPAMPIMALIRNLRNFDESGVSDKVAQQVIDKLRDPEVIARSRQFPFRFLAAHRATERSLRWAYPLEQALNLSLTNVPRLGGRTLIAVDRSPSMFPDYDYAFPKSRIEGISRADQAAVFGAALALRADSPTLVWFGGDSREVAVPRGGSVLQLIKEFGASDGTDIPSAIKRHYANHDRVIVLTDEQTRPGYFPSNMMRYGGMDSASIDSLVPRDVPVYMWNFAGYSAAAMASGSDARFTMGGLSDGAFRMISQIEAGRTATWPWESTGVA